ncbi:MAG: cell surface protein SprA [Bacteroidota bacterium]
MSPKAYITVFLVVAVFSIWDAGAVTLDDSFLFSPAPDTLPGDTIPADSVGPYEPTYTPTYQPDYRFGDPFSNRISPSPLQLTDPSNIDLQVEYDSGINYTIYEKIGDVNFRPMTSMSFDEYNKYNDQQIAKEYFQERSAGLDGESAVKGRNLIPRLYVGPAFDRLFGGSYVDIQPNGFVNLDFGGRFQRINNPAIPLRQQRNGGFNFNQQISLNVVGKVGEKLAITANFDNNNTFDFQNNLKVEYTGYEEDIVKKIEIGNVSMPVSNSLMTGAQSLFGVKTQLQFGKLFVTGVLSRQQGQTEVLTIESGFQGREFEVRASDYDENRHFFLGHFFRNNYENWHRNLPQIISGVNITRVEVYLINRTQDTRTTRNVVGFMDLGEGSTIYRSESPYIGAGQGNVPTYNGANTLYQSILNNSGVRNSSETSSVLQNDFGFTNSTDYVLIQTARKLEDNEFTVNKQLGYITLLRKLQNDEALAVSYEYTYNGQVYKVGELTEDYSGFADDKVIFMKLLRPNKINSQVPSWNLMMKNIYNLNASQVDPAGFTLRIHYRDDRTGIDNPSLHEGRLTKDKPLLELMGLDQLNRNNDRQRDGNFDFIEGITIDTRNGNVIFPVLEPFGSQLRQYFNPETEPALIEKYVYDTLYRTTRADAQQVAAQNKYFILGKFNAGSSSEIVLPGINIAENSVVVTAGNTPLTEGLDYTVDYNLGRVRIINQGILSSGKTINISYEKADLFNFQSRWLYGTRLDYRFSDNFNIGGTLLHLNERPGGISRYKIGDEPTSNTKYGFDINYQTEANFLTKMVDFLPLISTKETSNIRFSAEFAQMVPGTSNIVNGVGTSYIDDFENAITPINLSGAPGWDLASTPRTQAKEFDLSTADSNLGVNFRRAKLAWYTIDQNFYNSGGLVNRAPDNISEEDISNHYVRPIFPQEIYRQRDRQIFQTPERIFDIAYYPYERGPYNYNPNLTPEGYLPNPEDNWAGITRAITNEVDFDKTNIEYLEFWMMDPFIQGERGKVIDGVFNSNNTTGGELVFNLGSISEDLMKDGRHAFENGLPVNGDSSRVDFNEWGRITTEPFLTRNFDVAKQDAQDIGLDGLGDETERQYFADFLNQINVVGDGLDQILADPSGDDFQYFLGPELDNRDAKILERYKNYNGLEGNSPAESTDIVRGGPKLTPNNEDLNNDNTISELEEYYEYRLSLRPGDLQIGRNHIVDEISTDENDPSAAKWYLFRIPIRDPDNIVGDINGFKTMRYVRMYLTKFRQPVVLRMSKLQLVGSQWRKFQETLLEPGFYELPEASSSDFNVSVVNIEENSAGVPGSKNKYRVPPGINRDRDNTTIINRQVNEQSLQVCIEDLKDQDARAVFKNVNIDLINYGRLKMFFHAEVYKGDMVLDDEVTAFLRLGTDYSENYYEIEVPLKITPLGVEGTDDELRRLLWPLENEIDIAIDELLGLKSTRNRGGFDIQVPFQQVSENGKYNLTVKGRPDISAVLTMMIGVRNPKSDDNEPKSICIWANEMRVTDFDKTKGWAANANLSTKLADLGTVNASTRYSSIGFGSIQENIQQRDRSETFQYDISANVNLDKFLLPEKTGLKVPMYASYEKSRTTPMLDPLDPDVPLEASLNSITNAQERQEYRKIVEDRSTRRSLNFTNVGKIKTNPEANDHFFDVENISLSYAYSDVVTSNVNTETYLQKTESGGVAYNYSPSAFIIEPFKKAKAFESPWLKLIKDINFSPVPSNLSFRTDLRRSFVKTQLYNEDLTIDGIAPYYERLFTFSRNYALRWNPIKNLNLDYSAVANAVIDEPDSIVEGDINTSYERDYIWERIKNLGRMKNFRQDINATFRVPLDKLPITDWLSADLKYSVGYNWVAGSLNQEDIDGNFFGHTISNRRDRGVISKVDFVKLYNKIDFLKDINAPPRRGANEANTFSLGKSFLRTLMSLRSITANYNIRESTTMSGFIVTPFLFGMDSSWNSPGWNFILGGQDADIRFKAAENGWLTRSPVLTAPFQQTFSTDIDIRAAIEPATDVKISLDAKRTNSANFQEIFRFNDTLNAYSSLTPARSGSYNITFISIKTAFGQNRENNTSLTYNQFAENIDIIQKRLEGVNQNGEFNRLSQDVLIPSFLAAYGGENADQSNLSPFPKIPLPNWRLDYTGLSKIPGLSDIFSSVAISHAYRSAFNVNNYTNSLKYQNNITLDNNILDYPEATIIDPQSGTLIPVYIINQVSIAEQFSPLMGINIRTKKNLSTRIEYRKERNLSLNMSNAQITEVSNNDITLDFGLTKEDFKLPFKIQGRTVALENDVTIRVSMTLRDSETIQRKLEGENTVTNGNTNFQLRPSLTYKLNDQLDLTMYFERSVTDPKISSFRTATTAFGTQLRFGLAQ